MPDAQFFYVTLTCFALLGWLVLIVSVFRARESRLAGRVVPAVIALFYGGFFIAFWGDAPGGFDSISGLQSLFTSPWLTLVAWLHYLAGDLVVGSHMARHARRQGWSTVVTVPVLVITMVALPIGLLVFEAVRWRESGQVGQIG